MSECDGIPSIALDADKAIGTHDVHVIVRSYPHVLWASMNTGTGSHLVPSGEAFRITDLSRLESDTLPSYFRHSRFQSLVRQLNFYNFRKINRERTFWCITILYSTVIILISCVN
ncbi:hypothetical protein QTG54_016282 [Skeletonema marinoi]|uniref:HSF-type DNA-binding domain-containing protein n=1 Tax=Skeletonema marinoi TaxID=267567 RepID=A0AAD8XSC8_9STRA|nr:hypothetical protein QTG54_016282 [Skeletonema marinoi]